MAMRPLNAVGHVYRCPVCGSEVSVIKGGPGELAPRCCNRPMMRLAELHVRYFCPICGSELLVLRPGDGDLAPRCCNRRMARWKRAA
jgi:desulfoferrodoxin-like iron-binding protein